MKFDSYFNLMIAFAVKTVLAMINDDAWRATDDNEDKVRKLFSFNSHCDVYGISIVMLIHLTRELIEPQVGKNEISQYRDIISKMLDTGEIARQDVGLSGFYHLNRKTLAEHLQERKF